MNAKELKEAFLKLPPMEGEIEKRSWKARRQSMREHVRNSDMTDLLKWSTVAAVMFVGEAPYIEQELEYLLAQESEKWKRAIREPGFGNPTRLSYYENTCGNLVHQAYHLLKWEESTGRSTGDVESIFEFGGGYGAMALVARQLGFQGRYTLYDFLEMLLLQKFYLSNVNVKARLMTNLVAIEYDLFIACFSISEAPIDVRAQALNTITARSYLFVFQGIFDGVDNLDYFHEFAKVRSDLKWHLFETTHGSPAYYYMMGA